MAKALPASSFVPLQGFARVRIPAADVADVLVVHVRRHPHRRAYAAVQAYTRLCLLAGAGDECMKEYLLLSRTAFHISVQMIDQVAQVCVLLVFRN